MSKIRFYKDLYISSDLKKKKSRLKWALKYGSKLPDLYLITIADGRDLYEIMHCRQLKQSYYQYHPLFVVGLASDYTEALTLIQEILLDNFQLTGEYAAKERFQCR